MTEAKLGASIPIPGLPEKLRVYRIPPCGVMNPGNVASLVKDIVGYKNELFKLLASVAPYE